MGKNENLQRIVVETQAILDDLEREGLIAKNGKYRRSRSGKLQPVYAATQKGSEVYPDSGTSPLSSSSERRLSTSGQRIM